jgi:hypothetical protein
MSPDPYSVKVAFSWPEPLPPRHPHHRCLELVHGIRITQVAYFPTTTQEVDCLEGIESTMGCHNCEFTPVYTKHLHLSLSLHNVAKLSAVR